MKAFLVCFLLISVLVFPSCVSARELIQNEEMSSDKVGVTANSGNLPAPPSTSKCDPQKRECKKIYPSPGPPSTSNCNPKKRDCKKIYPSPPHSPPHSPRNPAGP